MIVKGLKDYIKVLIMKDMDSETIERALYHKDCGPVGIIKILIELLEEKKIISEDDFETKLIMKYGAI
jgi:hypothetical protein